MQHVKIVMSLEGTNYIMLHINSFSYTAINGCISIRKWVQNVVPVTHRIILIQLYINYSVLIYQSHSYPTAYRYSIAFYLKDIVMRGKFKLYPFLMLQLRENDIGYFSKTLSLLQHFFSFYVFLSARKNPDFCVCGGICLTSKNICDLYVRILLNL